MEWQWVCWALALTGAAVRGSELTDEEYHRLPRLFVLDDMSICLSRPRATYCLGTFTLRAHADTAMYNQLQQYSLESHHFNRTLLYRGYCLTSRCPSPATSAALTPAADRFERCVSDSLVQRYQLSARLLHLDHCTTTAQHQQTKPLDIPEIIFAAVVVLVLCANVLGTLYEVFRSHDSKPNPYFSAWSVSANWRRLTADHVTAGTGDPRLNALAPVQGLRVMILMVVMMAHSVLGHYMTYVYNPEFLEKAHLHLLAMLIRNGTMVVQMFFVLSAFLMAYNMLLVVEKGDEKKPVGLRMLPGVIVHRIIRIAPTYMMAVGLQATWWVRFGSGPLWSPVVGAETAVCRKKWWTHFLFLNNLIYVDDMCLLPSWFLAADMQLYIVCAVLTLLLAPRPRWAVPLLGTLLAAAVAGNYLAAYHYGLQPMVKVISPEMMRSEYVSHASFKWLYAAAWGSLPAALVGLGLAFLYKWLQDSEYPLQQNKVFCVVYRLSFWLLVCWILSGVWWQHLEQPVAVAAYAALERPVFAIGTAVFLLGVFLGIHCVPRAVCAASCWRVLGRLALGVLLLHWPLSQGQLADRVTTSPVSIVLIGGHLFTTIFLTYWSALLAYLLLEAPAQRFLHLIIFGEKR